MKCDWKYASSQIQSDLTAVALECWAYV